MLEVGEGISPLPLCDEVAIIEVAGAQTARLAPLDVQPGDIFQYYQNESEIRSIVIPNPDPQVSATVVGTNASSTDSNKKQYRSAAEAQDPDWRVW